MTSLIIDASDDAERARISEVICKYDYRGLLRCVDGIMSIGIPRMYIYFHQHYF